MDIKQIIKDALLKRDCVIEEDNSTGIITIYTPDRKMWDFTIPIEMKITPKQLRGIKMLKQKLL